MAMEINTNMYAFGACKVNLPGTLCQSCESQCSMFEMDLN